MQALDDLVDAGTFPTRSDAVRGAIDLLVTTHRGIHIDRQIVESYTTDPQGDEELAMARAAAQALIEEEPW